jgi:hypothetical protein
MPFLLQKSVCGSAALRIYSIRHTFRTATDDLRDDRAVGSIIGHVEEGIESRYIESISDARLQAVTYWLRSWLWHPPLLPPAEGKADARR